MMVPDKAFAVALAVVSLTRSGHPDVAELAPRALRTETWTVEVPHHGSAADAAKLALQQSKTRPSTGSRRP
jgi:uncharacterized protein (DUF305 family)